ncbi:MAG: hypothetical protein OEZ58_05100 [Gammaproteobacteria bacterium]|nr:hypothetical protein [Gammaproteobacteria bacterium]MDH5728341.1 hypothetical protein [Gammaproteobacteria bacterium]
MLVKKLTQTLLAGSLVFGIVQSAMAEMTADFLLTSNNFVEGLSVTDDGPGAQLGLGYAHQVGKPANHMGLHAGLNTFNIAGLDGTALAYELSVGFAKAFSGVGLELGAVIPNDSGNSFAISPDYFVGASYKMISAGFATNADRTYMSLGAEHALGPVTLSLHGGNTSVTGFTWLDASFGASMPIKWVDLNAAVIYSDAPIIGDTKFQVGVSKGLEF